MKIFEVLKQNFLDHINLINEVLMKFSEYIFNKINLIQIYKLLTYYFFI